MLVKYKERRLFKTIAIVIVCLFVYNDTAFALAPEKRLSQDSFQPRFQSAYDMTVATSVTNFVRSALPDGGINALQLTDPERVQKSTFSIPREPGRKHEVLFVSVPDLFKRAGLVTFIDQNTVNGSGMPVVYVDRKKFNNEKLRKAAADIIARIKSDARKTEVEEQLIGQGITGEELDKVEIKPWREVPLFDETIESLDDFLREKAKVFIHGEIANQISSMRETLARYRDGVDGSTLGTIQSVYRDDKHFYMGFARPKRIGLGEEFFDKENPLSDSRLEALFHELYHATFSKRYDESTHLYALRLQARLFWRLKRSETEWADSHQLGHHKDNKLCWQIYDWKRNKREAAGRRSHEDWKLLLYDLRHSIRRGGNPRIRRDHNPKKLLELLDEFEKIARSNHRYPIENRYLMLKAASLLEKKEKEALVNLLEDQYSARKKLAIVDSLLLMLKKKMPEPKDYHWVRQQAPNVEGRSVWQVASEIWKPVGGLGRVMQFHGLSMNELLQKSASLCHLEPYYEKSEGVNTDYAKILGVEKKDIRKCLEFDIWLGKEGEGIRCRAVCHEVVLPSGIKVYLMEGHREDGNNFFFTKGSYDYYDDQHEESKIHNRAADKCTRSEFSWFFSRASLEFIRRMEEKKKKESKDSAWKAPIIHFNDGQLGFAPFFRKVYYKTDEILRNAFVAFTTHTYQNRIYANRHNISGDNDGLGIRILKRLLIDPQHWKYFHHGYGNELRGEPYRDVIDLTSAGIRCADWAGGVSANQVNDVIKYDNWSSRDMGDWSYVEMTAVTNGDKCDITAHKFRELMGEACKNDTALDLDYPTPEQLLKTKKFAKERLNDLIRSKKYITELGIDGIDPELPLITYSGRVVEEKISMSRAFSEENIRKMIDAGIQVVIGANVNSDVWLKTELGKLMKKYAGDKGKGKGRFIIIYDIDIEDQRAILAATDIQVQDSEHHTEAAGYTEADAGACGALELAPFWDEGILQAQGIRINPDELGEGNTLIPANEGSGAYFDILKTVLIDKPRDKKMDPLKYLAEYQVTALHLSQILDARMTAAEYLRQWSNGIEKRGDLSPIDYSFGITEKDIDYLHKNISAPANFVIPPDLKYVYPESTDRQNGVAKAGYNNDEIIIWAFNPTPSNGWATFDLKEIFDRLNPSVADSVKYVKESIRFTEGDKEWSPVPSQEPTAKSLKADGISVHIGPKGCEIIRLRKNPPSVVREGVPEEGPALFVDPDTGNIRGLRDDEHDALHNAIRALVNFDRPESIEYDENGVRKLNEEEMKRLVKILDIRPGAGRDPPVKINAFVIENGNNSKLAAALPDKYKYLARCVITHAGRWRTDPDKNPHANLFITRSAYEKLLSYSKTSEELIFWRHHEISHLDDRDAPIDTALTNREKRLACRISGKIVRETKFDKNNRYIWNHELGIGRIANYDEINLENYNEKIKVQFLSPDGRYLYENKIHASTIVLGNVYGSFFLLTGKTDRDEFEARAGGAVVLGRPTPVSIFSTKIKAEMDPEERERLAMEAGNLLKAMRDPNTDFVSTANSNLLKKIANRKHPLAQIESAGMITLLADVEKIRRERKQGLYNIDNSTIVERLIMQQLFRLGAKVGSPSFANHLRRRLPKIWKKLDGKLNSKGKIKKSVADSLIAISRSNKLVMINGWVNSLVESGRYSERAAYGEVGRWIRRAIPAVEVMLKELDPSGSGAETGAASETAGWVRPDLVGVKSTIASPRVKINITSDDALDYIKTVAARYCEEKDMQFDSANVMIGEITAEDVEAVGIKPRQKDLIFYRTAMIFRDARNGRIWVKLDPLFVGRIMAYQIANLELKEPILPDGEKTGAITTLNLAKALIYRTVIHEIGKHGANGKERAAIVRIYRGEELAEGVSSEFAPYNQGARLFDRIFSEEGVTEREEFIKALDLYLDVNPIIYRKIKRESVREAAIGWYDSWAVTFHSKEAPFRRCYTISPSLPGGPLPQVTGDAAFDTGGPQSRAAGAGVGAADEVSRSGSARQPQALPSYTKETIRALEEAGGNRSNAASILNITETSLSRRISIIRKVAIEKHYRRTLKRLEKALLSLPPYTEKIVQALEEFGDNKSNVAIRLGITRATVARRIGAIRKAATKMHDRRTLRRLKKALSTSPSLPSYTEETLEALEVANANQRTACRLLKISPSAISGRIHAIRKAANKMHDKRTLRRLKKALSPSTSLPPYTESTIKALEASNSNQVKAAILLKISPLGVLARIHGIRKAATKMHDRRTLRRLKKALSPSPSLPSYTEETIETLKEFGGNQSRSARRLGMFQSAVEWRINAIREAATKMGDKATLTRLKRALSPQVKYAGGAGCIYSRSGSTNAIKKMAENIIKGKPRSARDDKVNGAISNIESNVRQIRLPEGLNKYQPLLDKAIADLCSLQLLRTKGVILSSRNVQKEDDYALGFYSRAPPVEDILKDLPESLILADQALDNLEGAQLEEYLLHEALCHLCPDHDTAKRITKALYYKENYKDVEYDNGRLGLTLRKIIDDAFRERGTPQKPVSKFVRVVRKDPYLEEPAIDIIKRELAMLLPSHARILDLMSGYNTHLPDSAEPAEVVGIGLNREELTGNSKITEPLVRDLNRKPVLPKRWRDRFNAALMISGMAYLKEPKRVFAGAAETLKDGGLLFVTFNDCYQTGDPAMTRNWYLMNFEQKIKFTLDEISRSGAFVDIGHKEIWYDGTYYDDGALPGKKKTVRRPLVIITARKAGTAEGASGMRLAQACEDIDILCKKSARAREAGNLKSARSHLKNAFSIFYEFYPYDRVRNKAAMIIQGYRKLAEAHIASGDLGTADLNIDNAFVLLSKSPSVKSVQMEACLVAKVYEILISKCEPANAAEKPRLLRKLLHIYQKFPQAKAPQPPSAERGKDSPANAEAGAAALIERLSGKRISWRDPVNQGDARDSVADVTVTAENQWKILSNGTALDADVKIAMLPTKEEIARYSDLEKLETQSAGKICREGAFGALSGKFYHDKDGQLVFVISIIQTGDGWKGLERKLRDRYDPPRGASKRPEGNLYSWYGSGIVLLENELRSLGVKKIVVISNKGIKALRDLSGVSLNNNIIDKMYGKPGPGYDSLDLSLRIKDRLFSINCWVKNLEDGAGRMVEATQLAWDDVEGEEIMNDRAENARKFVMENLRGWAEDRTGLRGLNIGSGPGKFSSLIESAVRSTIIDIDITPRAKGAARAGRFINGDACSLPVAAASQDFILSTFLFNYVADRDKAADEMMRALKDGGRAVLILHNPDSELFVDNAFNMDPRPYDEQIEDLVAVLKWFKQIKDAIAAGRRIPCNSAPVVSRNLTSLKSPDIIKAQKGLPKDVANDATQRAVLLSAISNDIDTMKAMLRMTLLQASRYNMFKDEREIKVFFEKKGFEVRTQIMKDRVGGVHAFGVILDKPKTAEPHPASVGVDAELRMPGHAGAARGDQPLYPSSGVGDLRDIVITLPRKEVPAAFSAYFIGLKPFQLSFAVDEAINLADDINYPPCNINHAVTDGLKAACDTMPDLREVVAARVVSLIKKPGTGAHTKSILTEIINQLSVPSGSTGRKTGINFHSILLKEFEKQKLDLRDTVDGLKICFSVWRNELDENGRWFESLTGSDIEVPYDRGALVMKAIDRNWYYLAYEGEYIGVIFAAYSSVINTASLYIDIWNEENIKKGIGATIVRLFAGKMRSENRSGTIAIFFPAEEWCINLLLNCERNKILDGVDAVYYNAHFVNDVPRWNDSKFIPSERAKLTIESPWRRVTDMDDIKKLQRPVPSNIFIRGIVNPAPRAGADTVAAIGGSKGPPDQGDVSLRLNLPSHKELGTGPIHLEDGVSPLTVVPGGGKTDNVPLQPVDAQEDIAKRNVHRKCLVLDCDGVLWGGIVGEDGIDGISITSAHKEFQRRIKQLKEEGFILAINSKNNLQDVLEVLDNHPDMVLRKSDFAAMKVNWQDKAANMSEIAQKLNIGIDSLIFLDDNPHERELVRMVQPSVLIPELPVDPAGRIELLDKLNIFAAESVTDEDRRRTELYAARAEREGLQNAAASIEDYYRSLDMKVFIREDEENIEYIPRLAQLTQRTNQFNLTTKRYTEKDMERFISERDRYSVYSLGLIDKFGNSGIVGLVILDHSSPREVVIDTFCLSCRATGLTIENALMAYIMGRIKYQGAARLVGTYRPTPANDLVKDIYSKLGFKRINVAEERIYQLEIVPSNAIVEFPEYIALFGAKENFSGAQHLIPEILNPDMKVEELAREWFRLARAHGLSDIKLRQAWQEISEEAKSWHDVPDEISVQYILKRFLILEIASLGLKVEIGEIMGDYKTTSVGCESLSDEKDRLIKEGYVILRIECTGVDRSSLPHIYETYRITYARQGQAHALYYAVPMYSNTLKYASPLEIMRIYDICIEYGQTVLLVPSESYSLPHTLETNRSLSDLLRDFRNKPDTEWEAYLEERFGPPDELALQPGNSNRVRIRGIGQQTTTAADPRAVAGGKKVLPAELLKALKEDPLFAKAMDKKDGLRLDGITSGEVIKMVSDAGILVPVAPGSDKYSFSDIMRGENEDDTKTFINALQGVNWSLPIASLRELIKMAIINEINRQTTIPEGKVLWHIIEQSIVAESQRSSFAQQLNKFSRESKGRERIWILRRGESIRQAMARIKRICPNAVFDVALSSVSHIKRIPVLSGDNKIKMLVFEGSAGDFRQLEGVVAALRALHGDDIIATLRGIYSAMKGTAYDRQIPPDALDDPEKLARAFIFDLPPVKDVPADDLPKLNARLLKLLIAA